MDEVDEAPIEPTEAVEAADVDKAAPAKKTAPKGRPQYPFPRKTLEDALRVPTAIRTYNGGEPYEPAEIAKALNVGGKTGNFFYLTTAARDYGLTEGTRDSAAISLTPLGKQAVYPTSDEEAAQARLSAFLHVALFKAVLEHYKGSKLPDDRFVRNTLETRFGLDARTHDDFLDVFRKNCRYLGIGAEWPPAGAAGARATSPAVAASAQPGVGQSAAPRVQTRPVADGTGQPLVCFVAMPFSEKTEQYAPGFFTEVFASLFKPAIEAAGFEVRTARSQGSDLIHSTIVNGLLDADLVLVDLTEHNPNVLFELGLRIAEGKPTVLVKAIGTNPIFDVDNLMRVQSYNPNLWPSTVKDDLPNLTAHIEGAWAAKDTERSFMEILRQTPAPVA